MACGRSSACLGGLELSHAFLAAGAYTVDIEREKLGAECRIAQGVDLLRELRCLHRTHFAARGAHEVMVALGDTQQHAFVLGGLVAELVAPHEACFEKELHCGVDRRQAHVVAFHLHGFVEGVNIKMRIRGKHFLQDGEPLGCAPHFLFFEILRERGAGRVEHFVVVHSRCIGKDKQFLSSHQEKRELPGRLRAEVAPAAYGMCYLCMECQITPCPIMALATFMKPAMLAPFM